MYAFSTFQLIDTYGLYELRNSKCRIQNYCCPGKILLIDEKTIIARVSGFCKSRGLATTQPDTSTLGDAPFYVSFVGKLNNGMAEMPTAAQLKGKRKMQHRKAYERLAGLRPSTLKGLPSLTGQ